MSFSLSSSMAAHFEALHNKLKEEVTIRRYTETIDSEGYLTDRSYSDTVTSVVFQGDRLTESSNQPEGVYDLGTARVYTLPETDITVGDEVIRSRDSSEWEAVAEEGEYTIAGDQIFKKIILRRRQP